MNGLIYVSNAVIPVPLNDLLVKLKVFSMVEPGKKINMNTMTFVDSASWIGSITRNITGEGRRDLMVHLHQLIQQTIGAIETYKDSEFYPLLIETITQARVGIGNLITTYQSYPSIVAQIEICISNLDIQLDKYRAPH